MTFVSVLDRPDLAVRLPAIAVTALAPIVVVLTLLVGGAHAAALLAAAIAATGFLIVVARQPVAAFIGLLIWQPFSVVVLSLLFRFGAPASVVHALGGIRDLVVLGVVLAALTNRRRRRLDLLDKVALALVLVVSAYIVAPYVAPGLFAPTTLNVRALAWRTDVEYAILFVALRHAPAPAWALRRATAAVMGVAVVVAVGALVEFTASSAWNHFLVSVVQVQQYKLHVLHLATNPTDALFHGVIGSHPIIRVGSFLLSPLTLGFYLFAAWALSLRLLSGRRTQLLPAATAALVGASILVTLTRSAVLGALVVAFAAVTVATTRRSSGRVRVGVLLLAVVIAAAPLAGSSSLGQRTAAAVQGSDVSTSSHIASMRAGVNALGAKPLGNGLGTQPGIGKRFLVQGRLTAEDYYLGLGDEVGAESMLLFIAMYVLLVHRLRVRARWPGPVGSFSAAMWATAWGLAVGALFLHVWLDVTLSLLFWGLAALALHDRWTPPAPT